MAMTLQESGILPQLLRVREEALVGAAGPVVAQGWDEDTNKYVTGLVSQGINLAVEKTLQVLDAEGFYTKVDTSTGEPMIVDVVHQEMADEWVKAINT